MSNTAFAEIHLKALHHNLGRIRQAAPHSHCMAIIKANAYGHGMLEVAAALQDADAFGVARFNEALALRAAGITKPVCVLEGIHFAEQLDDACAHKLDLVFHHTQQLDWLEQTAVNEPLNVWIKIDTGMHRLGFRPDQLADVWQRLQNCQWVRDIKLMTHFANADDRNSQYTHEQLQHFNNVCNSYQVARSLANSAAILGWPETHADWVRPGIMLYGASPFLDGNAAADGLQPVMTLRSQLIAINDYAKGDAIGYGGMYVCDRPMRVGVVAIGYGDGYPRHARTGTPVVVNGQRCGLLGRVSMDMISVDLTDCPEARIGDEAVLWGEGLPVDEVARHADTIAYELLCGVTQRVLFNVVKD